MLIRMKTNPPTMTIDPNDSTTFSMKIPPGTENDLFGALLFDFADFELSGFETGVTLKTTRWMQEQTDGPLDARKTMRAIEGWRMRMRREFLGWGTPGKPDCWDYIPVALREWCDSENPSAKWREYPVLFLWRCHLWQARLRGCREIPTFVPTPGKRPSPWIREYGWLFNPINNKIIWTPHRKVSFKKVPADVAEFLERDRANRSENPATPPIWDESYDAHGEMEAFYRFEAWTGPENWTPPGAS
jgi:hypothetical protein